MRQRWLTLPLGLMLVAAPAFPCGGSGADIVDRPLVSANRYLSRLVHDDEYEMALRLELRFLEPFRVTMPDSVANVYDWSYFTGANLYSSYVPDDTVRLRYDRELLGPVRDRLARGTYAEAVTAARRAVDAVLDQPAGLAIGYAGVLRTAVEVIDVAPRLTPADRAIAARYFGADTTERQALGSTGGLPAVLREALAIRSLPRDSAATFADAHADSPRAASLRFVALQQAMRNGIPDGYAFDIKDSVPPARWAELERLHDDWLRRYASHAMADYVRLSKVRLFYFKNDGDRAWNELLTMYPRHRQRVLGEMRYLVYRGVLPPSLDDTRIDWPLRAALLMESGISTEQWNTYWRATEAHAGESWVVPMQERLLWRSIELADSLRSLPQAFPKRPMAPSGLWAGLRLIALLEAGDVAAAFAQADSTADSTLDVAAIRARLHLIRREWGRAIEQLGAGVPSTNYLIRVMAPPGVVDSLARAGSPFETEARLTTTARRAAAGDWRSAARAATGTGTERERLWSRTVALAADTSRAGTLAFARWMRAQHGRLFFGENTDWMRGLNWRRYAIDSTGSWRAEGSREFDTRLPWTASQERERIATHLQSTTELFYALRAYARWLDRATAATPGLAAIVREADQVYNRLVNWDANNSRYWGETLETSAEARSIRRAGMLLRRR